MNKYRSYIITLLSISISIFLFTKCINIANEQPGTVVTSDSSFEKYAGSQTCASCHKDIYDKHMLTAHFLTSAIATETNIKGSFQPGMNSFVYNNGNSISMEKKADGFYQAGYINGIEKKSQRFDMVIGSGTKGQSYASWVHNKLVQLPITYFTAAHQWSNSPGYPNKMAFNRPITSRCLECHSTYADKISSTGVEPEEFDRNRIISGVDCEKCHGPAGKHVAFQTKNPLETKAKYIINPATFSRLQSLDMCSLCHGGRLQKSQPSFEFTAGDKLSDFFVMDTTAKDANNIDVHGNQYGLLAASKCFKLSKTLTCISCHNTHENEKGKMALYSQRCMTCHSIEHKNDMVCKLTHTLGGVIKTNCIDCHMPEQPSMAIAVILQGATTPTPASMRTHYIKIYNDETKKILAYFKDSGNKIL
ncbi:MAG: multiheme c-type cytochrome [Ferruginibacter sp.]